MLFFFILIGVSLEKQYMIFSSFKMYLLTRDRIAAGAVILTFNDDAFNFALASKLSWMLFLFIIFNLLFFSWQMIRTKQGLFHQNNRSATSFYFIALAKAMVLFLPLLFVLYRMFRRILYPAVVFLTKGKTFDFPYSMTECIVWAIILLVWAAYAFTLFCGHFSFSSLLNVKLFGKNIKVVLELIGQIIVTVLLLSLCTVAIGYCCFKMDPIYLCFAGFLVYFLATLVSPSRWIFMTFFLVVASIGFYLAHSFGYDFFVKNLLIAYLMGILIYFSFFFMVTCLFSAFAYSFASTSFVFRFDQTPSKDIKKQAPEKLRRIDELYSGYLKEHKNDVQDNFFHHMEE